jgi:antitoxin MazE
MSTMIRSKVVKIGNSPGIRIPRTILEQAGLSEEVEMKVEGNQLIIQAARHPRQGWDEQFSAMADQGDDPLLDDTISTQWDEEEWTW